MIRTRTECVRLEPMSHQRCLDRATTLLARSKPALMEAFEAERLAYAAASLHHAGSLKPSRGTMLDNVPSRN